MKFLTLLAALFVLTLPGEALPPRSLPLRILAVAAGILLSLLFSWWAALSTVRRITPRPADRMRAANRYYRLHFASRVLDLAVFLIVCLLAGWVSIVKRRLGLDQVPLASEILILSPLLVGGWISATFAHRVELAFEQTMARSRPELARRRDGLFRIWTNFRVDHGYWLLVVGMVVISQTCLDLVLPAWEERPLLGLVALCVMASLLLLAYPIAIRLFWHVEPLAASSMRETLLEWSRRLKVVVRDILVWKTRYGHANAAITGLVKPLRYVLFTDVILEFLSLPELMAVFGHEAGHVRHRHMAIQLGVVLSGLVALVLIDSAIGDHLVPEAGGWLQTVFQAIPPSLVFGIPIIAAMVWYLSRRFERQADIAAVDAVALLQPMEELSPDAVDPRSDAARHHATLTFIRALHRVAKLNGMDVDKWSWRYGRLRERLRFLEKVGPSAIASTRFHRQTRHIVTALLACHVLVGAAAGSVLLLS